MSQSEYISICLHEAGHCAVAWSLGLPVSRLAAVIRPDHRVAGECHITLLSGDLIRSIAVLMGGINGCNLFSHFSFAMPAEAMIKATTKASKRRHNQIAKGVDSDDPLGAGRDGGLIILLLNGRPDSVEIFGKADELSRRALGANSLVVSRLTTRLAQRGELLARDIRDLAAQIVRIEV